MFPAPSEDRELHILLVEDNPDDVRLTEEILREGRIPGRLAVVTDGEQALEYLRRPGVPRPDLILLDLKLPRLDGQAVLAEIRRDPALCAIPVVVLTSSSNARDILRAQELRCSCYIIKPSGINEFPDLIKTIGFWLGVASSTGSD